MEFFPIENNKKKVINEDITFPPDFPFDSPEQETEIRGVIQQEILSGATQIGFFGSRIQNTHAPGASDTDMMVRITRRLDGRSVNPDERVGSISYFGKDAGQPSIHVTRVTPEMVKDRENPKRKELLHTLHETVWVWRQAEKQK